MEDILISILPVVVFIGVWIYIMWRLRKNSKNNVYTQRQDEMIVLLKEIRDELKELNRNNSIK